MCNFRRFRKKTVSPKQAIWIEKAWRSCLGSSSSWRYSLPRWWIKPPMWLGGVQDAVPVAPLPSVRLDTFGRFWRHVSYWCPTCIVIVFVWNSWMLRIGKCVGAVGLSRFHGSLECFAGHVFGLRSIHNGLGCGRFSTLDLQMCSYRSTKRHPWQMPMLTSIRNLHEFKVTQQMWDT